MDDKKIQRIAYVLLSLSLVMIISGGFSSFLINLREDHQEVLHRMEDVNTVFERFDKDTSKFEDFRGELYEDVLGNIYYDTMYKTDKDVKDKLKSYEEIVSSLTEKATGLNSLCGNVYYPDAEVNKICSNYKSTYEQVVNYFVTDINTYNENVAKYNKYQESINSKLTIKEYKTSYRYIDYNGDKVFDGKE